MDKKSLRILKLLRRKGKLTYKKIKTISGEHFHPEHDPYLIFLLKNNYIKYVGEDSNNLFYSKIKPDEASFEITRNGHEFLETHAMNTFRFAIPLIISILAILISFGSFLVTIIVNFS